MKLAGMESKAWDVAANISAHSKERSPGWLLAACGGICLGKNEASGCDFVVWIFKDFEKRGVLYADFQFIFLSAIVAGVQETRETGSL